VANPAISNDRPLLIALSVNNNGRNLQLPVDRKGFNTTVSWEAGVQAGVSGYDRHERGRLQDVKLPEGVGIDGGNRVIEMWRNSHDL
jgi:hypothetical protein